MKILAPIILFVYNRPLHTRQTLESLAKNKLSDQSILHIYLDAPNPNASQEDLIKIDEVKQIIYEKQWCREVKIFENKENLGIDYQTPLRINEIFEEYENVIVIEDDCVLSPGFLKYMNEVLELYKNEERVMHVSGWIPPIKKRLPKNYFLHGINHNWGWGTWKRAWKYYNPNVEELINQVKSMDENKFNMDGATSAMNYLIDVSKKPFREQNWDIIWVASVFVNNGLAHQPNKSLVNNVGLDGTGLHGGKYSYKTLGHKSIVNSINVKKISIEECKICRKIMSDFWTNRFKPTLKDKIKDKLKKEFKQIKKLIKK